jgi:hypothetical protein
MSEEERKEEIHMEGRADNYCWIRWILVLPVSIIFSCCLYFIVTIVSVFLGGLWWEITEFMVLFQSIVVLIVCPLLSILIGVSIAPRHKFITATCLAILYISFSSILMVVNLTIISSKKSEELFWEILDMLLLQDSPSKLIIVYLIGILVLTACCFFIRRIQSGIRACKT